MSWSAASREREQGRDRELPREKRDIIDVGSGEGGSRDAAASPFSGD
jgi:hypothetical protein